MTSPTPPTPDEIDVAARTLWENVRFPGASEWDDLAPDDPNRMRWSKIATAVYLASRPSPAEQARADATKWREGYTAGRSYERDMWYWQAGAISRRMHGLKERPEPPANPYGPEQDS